MKGNKLFVLSLLGIFMLQIVAILSPVNALTVVAGLVCEDPAVYCDLENGYSLVIPEGWVAEENPEEQGLILMYTKVSSDGFATLMVVAEDMIPGTSVETAFNSFKIGLASTGMKFEIKGYSDVKLGGVTVREIDILFKDEGLEMRGPSYLILNGNKLLNVTMITLAGTLSNFESEFDSIIDSLNVVENFVTPSALTPNPNYGSQSETAGYVDAGFQAGRYVGPVGLILIILSLVYRWYQRNSLHSAPAQTDPYVLRYLLSLLASFLLFLTMVLVFRFQPIESAFGGIMFGVLNLAFGVTFLYGFLNLLVVGIRRLTGVR